MTFIQHLEKLPIEDVKSLMMRDPTLFPEELRHEHEGSLMVLVGTLGLEDSLRNLLLL